MALSSSSLVPLLGIWSFQVFIWTIRTQPGPLSQTGSALSCTDLRPFVQHILALATSTCMWDLYHVQMLWQYKYSTFLKLWFKCVSFIKIIWLFYYDLNQYVHVCNSYLACADPGEILPGESRPDCQKAALKTFCVVVFFIPQLILQIYRGFPMFFFFVFFKKNYNFPRFERSPTFSRGVQLFPGGRGGVKMLISIENHITCDCVAAQTEENSHCFHCETSRFNIKSTMRTCWTCGEFSLGCTRACSD